jgi:hypothetical protein
MTQEALKLALEGVEIHSPNSPEYIVCAALIEALAQPEQEPVAWMRQDGQKVTTASDRHNYPDYETRYSIPLYTTPPQRTEQEPVAKVDANDEGYWAEILPDQSVKVGQLLYTTPPQRTWVGLTDEDWKEIEDMPDTFDQGVAWAQAKLKLKNGYAEEKNT